ncbi:MAG: elongation factor Ts [Mycoplasma sp.]|nr:elongation factor Ts [Mycoplasma sp.]
MGDLNLVKKLREMTQAGVMDVMKALKECDNDVDKAAQWLREKGIVKAAKKASAIVTEGVAKTIVNGNYAAVVEINSQTDFVVKGNDFQQLVKEIIQIINVNKPKNIDELNNEKTSKGTTVADLCVELTAKIGEKICIRRIEIITKNEDQSFFSYEHFNGKIAVVLLTNKNEASDICKSIAMHIAAMNPRFISANQADPKWVANEIEVIKKQTLAEGKPADRVDMIVKGRIQKILAENCLENQQFIKNPNVRINDLLKKNNINLIKFNRYEVGEGVEKKVQNFAEEVAQQMGK